MHVCYWMCMPLSVLHLLVQLNTLNETVTERQMSPTALTIVTSLQRNSVRLTQHNFFWPIFQTLNRPVAAPKPSSLTSVIPLQEPAPLT